MLHYLTCTGDLTLVKSVFSWFDFTYKCNLNVTLPLSVVSGLVKWFGQIFTAACSQQHTLDGILQYLIVIHLFFAHSKSCIKDRNYEYISQASNLLAPTRFYTESVQIYLKTTRNRNSFVSGKLKQLSTLLIK